MRRAVALATLLAMTASLAGCVSDDPTEEHLHIYIHDVDDVPYVIAVPLWLYDGGPTADDWMADASIVLGQVTEFHLNETAYGTALWIAGNGTVGIEFSDVRSFTGPAFADGRYSLGAGATAMGLVPRMLTQQGGVDVDWTYEATTESCYVSGSFTWLGSGTGWHDAIAGGRMSFSPDCPPHA